MRHLSSWERLHDGLGKRVAAFLPLLPSSSQHLSASSSPLSPFPVLLRRQRCPAVSNTYPLYAFTFAARPLGSVNGVLRQFCPCSPRWPTSWATFVVRRPSVRCGLTANCRSQPPRNYHLSLAHHVRGLAQRTGCSPHRRQVIPDCSPYPRASPPSSDPRRRLDRVILGVVSAATSWVSGGFRPCSTSWRCLGLSWGVSTEPIGEIAAVLGLLPPSFFYALCPVILPLRSVQWMEHAVFRGDAAGQDLICDLGGLSFHLSQREARQEDLGWLQEGSTKLRC